MQGNDSPLSSCVKMIAMSTATEERVTRLTGRDVQLPPMHNWTEDAPSTRRLIAYAMVLHFRIAAPNTAQTTRAMNDICDEYSNYPVKSRQLKRRMRLRYCQGCTTTSTKSTSEENPTTRARHVDDKYVHNEHSASSFWEISYLRTEKWLMLVTSIMV